MIGLAVRKLRERRGWSQKELAEKVGVKQQNIGQLENDEVLQPRYLSKLAKVFDLTIDGLYAMASTKEGAPSVASANMQALEKEFDEITPAEAEAMSALLRAIRAR